MTDQEIEQIAREYSEQNPPQTEDEKLKEFGMFLNATEVFEPFLYWLTKTHCIVNKEKVQKHHKDYAFLARKHPKASERHLAEVILEELRDLFGTELFEERSEK